MTHISHALFVKNQNTLDYNNIRRLSTAYLTCTTVSREIIHWNIDSFIFLQVLKTLQKQRSIECLGVIEIKIMNSLFFVFCQTSVKGILA
mmetsp:Transcript_19533/g.35216  ORF Transcript_19533/g.35216 Transcript_19533/m.35216 type:complete len:90 (-) Transcript_19533:413-682(-)